MEKIKNNIVPARTDFTDIEKLSKLISRLRLSNTVEQLQECFHGVLFSLMPVNSCVLTMYERGSGKTKWQLNFHVPERTGPSMELQNTNFQQQLFYRWCQDRSFFVLRGQEIPFSQWPDYLILVNGWSSLGSDVCLCVFECANPRARDMCPAIMDIVLPELHAALLRIIDGLCVSGLNALTEREVEVMLSIKQGADNKSIANQLNISVNTVKSHVYNVFRKLDVNNRVEALIVAEKAGFIS